MMGYEALREAAAWIDLDGRGRFRARGEDRARLLHAMTTNHVEQLVPGQGCYAFFLNAQGRILGDVDLLCLDDYFLLDVEAEAHQALFEHLDKFIIADDVTLEDARGDTCAIGVEGPGAPGLLQDIGGIQGPFTITGAAGGRLYAPAAEKAALIERLRAAGAVEATAAEAEAVRLEHFRPRYGGDITAKYLVHETQMLRGVHFSKGCYLGQEIVERVRSRGQVHRLLVPLYIDAAAPPAAGTPVLAGEAAVGETMSAAYSPALGRSIAFAYLRSEHARKGTILQAGGATAEVAADQGQ